MKLPRRCEKRRRKWKSPKNRVIETQKERQKLAEEQKRLEEEKRKLRTNRGTRTLYHPNSSVSKIVEKQRLAEEKKREEEEEEKRNSDLLRLYFLSRNSDPEKKSSGKSRRLLLRHWKNTRRLREFETRRRDRISTVYTFIVRS